MLVYSGIESIRLVVCLALQIDQRHSSIPYYYFVIDEQLINVSIHIIYFNCMFSSLLHAIRNQFLWIVYDARGGRGVCKINCQSAQP